MTDRATQRRIISELEVVQDFDASHEAKRRVRFLAEYLAHTRTGGLVLGISGGVDSSVGGRLCRLACEKVRADGGVATFVAMRLPGEGHRRGRRGDDPPLVPPDGAQACAPRDARRLGGPSGWLKRHGRRTVVPALHQIFMCNWDLRPGNCVKALCRMEIKRSTEP